MEIIRTLELFAEEADDGARLDKFLSERVSLSRSTAEKLIAEGQVAVNGKQAAKSLRLKANDEVTAMLPEPQPLDVLPQNIPLDIVYEDSDLLVVNKPKSQGLMCIHSGLRARLFINSLAKKSYNAHFIFHIIRKR